MDLYKRSPLSRQYSLLGVAVPTLGKQPNCLYTHIQIHLYIGQTVAVPFISAPHFTLISFLDIFGLTSQVNVCFNRCNKYNTVTLCLCLHAYFMHFQHIHTHVTWEQRKAHCVILVYKVGRGEGKALFNRE